MILNQVIKREIHTRPVKASEMVMLSFFMIAHALHVALKMNGIVLWFFHAKSCHSRISTVPMAILELKHSW